MSKPRTDLAGLVPGVLGLEADGSMPERPVPPPNVQIRTRYFAAVNATLKDGSHILGVLTPYSHTLPGANRALEELRPDLPDSAKPEILWIFATYDMRDAAQVRELAEVDAAAAVERIAEGTQ
jgi:hypothetical protein